MLGRHVFLEMGGQFENLEILLIDSADASSSSTDPRAPSLQAELEQFDPRNARCFTDHDTERLHKVIETTGYDRITKLVHKVFVGKVAHPDV